jgi:Cu(I)/Ag(I) efflux system membrane fusion protein
MSTIRTAAVALLAFAAGAALVGLATRERAEHAHAPPAAAGADARKVLYWFDPMYPDQRFDKPGKSPFMDMQLVPKYADEGAAAGVGTVTIDPRLVQNLGVRTAPAARGTLAGTVRATGVIAFDERAVAVVAAPVAAIVERLHVRAPLDPVEAGAPLATLLAPDWTAAQQEYLGLRRARSPGLDGLRAAARQRLRLLGMTEAQIRALERSGRADPRSVVRAPRAGVIGELGVREGAAVMPGTLLARINGLDTLWVEAAVPERAAGRVGAGATALATVPAFPGRAFEGTVDAVLPSLDPATRTVTARIVLDNAERALVPGMFAELELAPAGAVHERVLVPSEAVIATGTRQVVIVAEGQGRFRAQEVRVGAEDDGRTEILEGLAEGERVVLSGQFLIDSEASLSGALARLSGARP